MRYIKIVSFILLAVASCYVSTAQNENPSNLTSSPYTRYGVGRIAPIGNAATRGMAGVGVAQRTSAYTNMVQPASLTAIDTLTMIFDAGLDVEWARYSEDGTHETDWNAGFAYMSFHFPLWRRTAMSLSLSPYSMVGYDFGATGREGIDSQIVKADTLVWQNTYAGNGGLQRVAAAMAWRALKTQRTSLDVGATFGYIYGTVSHGATAYISSGQAQSTVTTRAFTARGFELGVGVQWQQWLDARRSIVVGATFSPKLHLGVDADIEKYSNTDTMTYTRSIAMHTPLKAGFGVSYNVDRKLFAEFDFSFENWKNAGGLDANFNYKDDYYRNITKFAAGVEYRPSIYDQSYMKTCRYRAGLAVRSSYVEVYGSQSWEYTATLGLGLPVPGRRSILNVALEYSHLAPSKSDLLAEDCLRLTLGMTFNEVMFYRNRLR